MRRPRNVVVIMSIDGDKEATLTMTTTIDTVRRTSTAHRHFGADFGDKNAPPEADNLKILACLPTSCRNPAAAVAHRPLLGEGTLLCPWRTGGTTLRLPSEHGHPFFPAAARQWGDVRARTS